MKKSSVAALLIMLILSFIASQAAVAAEKTVRMTIPGCTSWGLKARVSSTLRGINGMINYNYPGAENIIDITFDDEKASVEKITASLKKEGIEVKGTSVLLNKRK